MRWLAVGLIIGSLLWAPSGGARNEGSTYKLCLAVKELQQFAHDNGDFVIYRLRSCYAYRAR